MNPSSRLFERWWPTGQGGLRRRILLEIVGLEPAAVDRYLGEGLLHNLALLSDVGGRACSDGPLAAQTAALRATASKRGVRVIELRPALESGDSQLSTICRDDELQQARLVEQLSLRPSNELLISTFDMPARLNQLFGSNPSIAERLVLRDVYARMDEVVGKAYSFVDDSVALAVVLAPHSDRQSICDAPQSVLLFSSGGVNSASGSTCMLQAALFPSSDIAAEST
jgi:hypothetical protein